jgi:hypothetical protein
MSACCDFTCSIPIAIRKYHLASFQNFRSLAPIIALIHEIETLRREAIHIEILYRIKPLRRTMVGLTYQ